MCTASLSVCPFALLFPLSPLEEERFKWDPGVSSNKVTKSVKAEQWVKKHKDSKDRQGDTRAELFVTANRNQGNSSPCPWLNKEKNEIAFSGNHRRMNLLLHKEEMTPAGCKFTPPRTRAGPQTWLFSSHMGWHLSRWPLPASCGFPVFCGSSGMLGTMVVSHGVRAAPSPSGSSSSSVWVSSCHWGGEKVPHCPGWHFLDSGVSSAAPQCSPGLSFKCHLLVSPQSGTRIWGVI